MNFDDFRAVYEELNPRVEGLEPKVISTMHTIGYVGHSSLHLNCNVVLLGAVDCRITTRMLRHWSWSKHHFFGVSV